MLASTPIHHTIPSTPFQITRAGFSARAPAVLSLACPSKGDVVLVAGDFFYGGRRVVPGWAAAAQNVALNHIAVFRVDDNGDLDASNLCPVGRPLPVPPGPQGVEAKREAEQQAQQGGKLRKASCTRDGSPAVMPDVGVTLSTPVTATGPPVSSPGAFVASMLCLSDDCADVVIGGRFSSVLGVEAYSVALLRFDDGFYSATAYVHTT